ncbi:hypothetical protein V6N13_004827 [Hibiscus sabdariffa]|uniref:Uncharacterized protein n=1 Tax=Hibiscus sabdariffa TaxID=183260 RepID=A0ABR2S0E4_9ROSI
MIQEGKLWFIENESRKGRVKGEIELKLGQKEKGIESGKGPKFSKMNGTVCANLDGLGNDGSDSMMGHEVGRVKGSLVEDNVVEQPS